MGLIPTMEAMQLNATECHTSEGSMIVDLKLVEVDRRESRFLDRWCAASPHELHMLTVLDGDSRAEWPVALIDTRGNSSDCDLFRRMLRICVQDI